MNGDEKKYLDERLIRLETRFDERWNAHDKFSTDHHRELDGKFDTLFSKVDSILDGKEESMRDMRGYTNKVVGMVVGVPVTILILFRLIQVLIP